MVDKQQARFQADFNFRWLLAASALMLTTSLSIRSWGRSAGLLLFAMVAVSYAMRYLPKFLHIQCGLDNRYRWAVRSRWILIAVGFLLAVALVRFQSAGILLAGLSAAWLVAVNGMVTIVARKNSLLSWEWAPYIYFAGDFWLTVVLAYVGLNWLVVVTLLAVSGFFALVLAEEDLSLTITALAAATALIQLGVPREVRGFAIYLNVILVLVFLPTHYLVHLAHRHAQRNPEQNVPDAVGPQG